MLNKLRKKMGSKKGFTLIELIVVIAILAILAIVAVPRLAGITTTARTNADKSTLATLNNSIQVWCANNDKDTFVGATDATNTIADNDTIAEVITVLKHYKLISTETALQGTAYTGYLYDAATNMVAAP